ncbi:MAG: cell division protein FtsZ [Gammaproteobacteria bacterium]|nr:cell division protein FtsZ [Gammaproteobacteria bacterium]MYG67956.1 cell division protein FtsZ [Gammaproteobacteria bacterium]
MFELVEAVSQQAVIKVIGVGGGGGNAVEHMLRADLDGVDFINANTDAQMLSRSNAPTILQLGENLTKGLGAGANPEIGRQAAMEDRDRISDAINGADMIFITAGMGGGTGTGATPVIAELAREKGALTVAVVTKPFPFEGQKRMDLAMLGIEDLQEHVDSLITVPNEKVLAVMGHEASLVDAFAKANEVLFNAVQGISELITRPGLINVDFADVRTVMAEMGRAMMGSATANGENRAVEAARQAISSPLLENINLYGAKGLLVNITAGPDMAIGEFEAVGNSIHEYAAPDANLVIGTAFDPEMQGDLRVTMVATGLCDSSSPKPVVEKPVKAAPPPPKEEKAEEKLPKGAMVPPRKFARAGGASMAEAAQLDLDHLEIPAFLRRQAD